MIDERMRIGDVVIGLGANLGDRRGALEVAVHELAALGSVVGVSALYETDPLGPPQPKFLNAAVRLVTELAPEPLLDALLAIERVHGRVRRERWGPRLLDLDILWAANVKCHSERLTIPHAELARRAFALLPLLDVAPEASTVDGVSYRAVSMSLDRSGVQELPDTRAGWVSFSGASIRGR